MGRGAIEDLSLLLCDRVHSRNRKSKVKLSPESVHKRDPRLSNGLFLDTFTSAYSRFTVDFKHSRMGSSSSKKLRRSKNNEGL